MVCEGCSKSWWRVVADVLLVIGGLNWGLVGAGILLGSDWNVVKMLLGGMPMVEAIVYLLVGVSAIVKIFGCGCHRVESVSSAPSQSMGQGI